jgi:hypothetical protein
MRAPGQRQLYKEADMAKRRSTSKVHSHRNRTAPQPRAGTRIKSAAAAADAGAADSVLDGLPENLEEAIEDERARLMKAHSILGCITLAMEGDDSASAAKPYYPDLIELVRELVNESINGLEAGKLERLFGLRGSR